MPSATRPSTATDWVASLDPWPEEFGLDRMRALLSALGDPQRAFPSIHVVGTNGKSTATRRIAGLLRAEGLRAGAYTSPHVSGWHERLDCDPASFERAVARVRGSAEPLGATQFEVLTAAALAHFAEAEVEVGVVEAGLGGRLDATNVVDAPVVLLTNVALEHTEVLGDTKEEIAREKLAVAHAARVVVASDNTFESLVPDRAKLVLGGAKEAAEAFLGRPIEHEVRVQLPGRLEYRGQNPLEVWDGAHNPAAVEYLVGRLTPRKYLIVASILADKDADAMLASLARVADALVATQSSNPRSLNADELFARAAPHFSDVMMIPDPKEALRFAREFAGPEGTILLTGSLYLLADLYA
jgi:dihydrofolate synthase/folylpolyglutamate synthase